MLANFTTATTAEPLQVAAVPNAPETPEDLVFEVAGAMVARRRFARAEDAIVVAACLRRPVYLHLLATEDTAGYVRALLTARLPGASDGDPVVIPLGAVARAPEERSHPTDLSAEAADLLHGLAGVPVSEALGRAVDALLASL